MANTARNKPGEERVTTVKETSALDNLQYYYENNKNRINTIVIVIVAVVAGYFGYQKLYKEPREDKATTKSSIATRYYQMDSLNLALNGDGQNAGFLKIIKTYDGTSAANLARFYAGTCYLRMGDFNNAVKYLKDFNGKGTILAYEADGCIGDAYMEQGKIKDGIEYYKKASDNKDDETITPIYLYRLGVAYEMDKQNAEAKKAFMRIRDEYPKSVVARDIDKELAQLGVLD